MSEIDKNSVIPLYFQLADILKTEISDGRFDESLMLPSERCLCQKYELSRYTVRQAVQLLKEEGLVYKQKGVGCKIVTGKKLEQDLMGFHDFDLQMVEKGYQAEVKMVSYSTVEAPSRIGKLLQMNPDEMILVVNRVRLIEDIPLFIERLYFPGRLGDNLSPDDFVSTRLFSDILNKKCSVTLGEAHIFIEPVLLDRAEAALLAVANIPAPGLLLERISFDDKNKPVCVTKRIFRGDRCRHLLTVKPK